MKPTSTASAWIAALLASGLVSVSPRLSMAVPQEPGPAEAPVTLPRATPGPAVDENDDDDDDRRRLRVNATARLDLPAGTIQVTHPLLPATGPDASALAELEEGEVLELTRAMAVKLATEVEMRFGGGVVARPENVAAGYPGVYSLWLRRTGEGWSLVVNQEPDVWGTMRSSAADVGEAPLVYWQEADASQAPTLGVSLRRTNGGGQIEIAWGAHRFTAEFEAGPGMRDRAAGAQAEAP